MIDYRKMLLTYLAYVAALSGNDLLGFEPEERLGEFTDAEAIEMARLRDMLRTGPERYYDDNGNRILDAVRLNKIENAIETKIERDAYVVEHDALVEEKAEAEAAGDESEAVVIEAKIEELEETSPLPHPVAKSRCERDGT